MSSNTAGEAFKAGAGTSIDSVNWFFANTTTMVAMGFAATVIVMAYLAWRKGEIAEGELAQTVLYTIGLLVLVLGFVVAVSPEADSKKGTKKAYYTLGVKEVVA